MGKRGAMGNSFIQDRKPSHQHLNNNYYYNKISANVIKLNIT